MFVVVEIPCHGPCKEGAQKDDEQPSRGDPAKVRFLGKRRVQRGVGGAADGFNQTIETRQDSGFCDGRSKNSALGSFVLPGIPGPFGRLSETGVPAEVWRELWS